MRRRSFFLGVLDRETDPPHSVITRALVEERLQRAVARGLDVKLLHPVAKRVWMKVQDPRRALRAVNYSTNMLKGGEDMSSFYLVQSEERLRRLKVSLRMLWGIRLRNLNAFRRGGNRRKVAVQPDDRILR